MPESKDIVNMNLTSSLEQTSSLIEELAKAYVELEAQEDASCDNVQWKDVEAHFHLLESVMKKKLEEIEAKEKDVTKKESLLAEKEAAVTAKEQDILDRVQELKDAAVAAIMEAKVNCFDDENADGPLVAAELTQFCEKMDSKGLLKYVMEKLNNSSSVCRKRLSVVLVSASEPTRLVLDALSGFFPPNETTQHGEDRDGDDPLRGMRLSCILLMEALSAFLAKADPSADKYLNPETKQLAKAIADEWKPKLALESNDAANGKSLEARAFLWLLVTFRIASEFNEEELCKYVLAIAHHRQATELCRSLELSQKIPGLLEKCSHSSTFSPLLFRLAGIVETLLESRRNVEAVNFILSFQLGEAFPPVPLLKAYLKDVRRNIQGNGDAETQNDYNARELTAVKAVMRCVKEYKLEAEYPLDPLRKRLIQLQNAVGGDSRKRKREGKYQRKELQGNGGSIESEARVSENGRKDRHFSSERAAYNVLTDYPPTVPSAYSYPVSTPAPYTAHANERSAYSYPVSSQAPYPALANERSAYSYPVSSQPTYAAPQANDQRSYYYSQGDMASTPYSTAAPTYGACMRPPQPPYM